MKNNIYFTAGQFAKLHHINKRTLHYYDEIGLFSPDHKGPNEYRYYSHAQSIALENILALRELGMSIEELKNYMKRPNSSSFLTLSEEKISEIDKQIAHLKELKKSLQEKQDSLHLSTQVYDGKIEQTQFDKEYMYLTPIQMGDQDFENIELIMNHLQLAWKSSPFKTDCGSYISLDKVKNEDFDFYDGLFTPVTKPLSLKNITVRPKGTYLCGYSFGDWNKIPLLYQQMLIYAKEANLTLTGACYEIGLNQFAIASAEEYITQIAIQCVE